MNQYLVVNWLSGKPKRLREAGLVVAMLAGKDLHPIRAFHHHRSFGYPSVLLGDRCPGREAEAFFWRGEIPNIDLHIRTLVRICVGHQDPGFDIGIVGIASEPVFGGQLVIGEAKRLREAGLVVAMFTGKDLRPIGALHHHRSIRNPIVVLGYCCARWNVILVDRGCANLNLGIRQICMELKSGGSRWKRSWIGRWWTLKTRKFCNFDVINGPTYSVQRELKSKS